MLTNEQRAHDLALFMLNDRKDSVIREQIEAGNLNVTFDIYKEYKALYEKFLETFNRDFQQNER